MMRLFRIVLTAIVLCLIGVPGVLAGELENQLIDAAVNGDAAGVQYLLNKGADVNAKDNSGETALMKAAYYGYADVVRILVEKGASVELKNSSGETALQLAQLKNHADIVALLQNALSNNPQARFTEYLTDFQKNPWKDDSREKVVQAAASLPNRPPVPDEAKQDFQQATAVLKTLRGNQSSSVDDLYQPIELLKKALDIAPWWANAYYNLALAQEASGQYDEAIKQLNYYLELKPSDADAADARSKIAVIQAEKESAANKKQQKDATQAVNYVSGGVTRLRPEDAPAWWRPNEYGGIVTLYLYGLNDDPYYLNAFRMPNGRILVIGLSAKSNNGAYGGDSIYVVDLTVASCRGSGIEGQGGLQIGAQGAADVCGYHYDIDVTAMPDAVVSVKASPTETIALPVALLYRARALKAGGAFGGCGDGTMYQGGASAMKLKFDCSVVQAAQDPNANAMGLTPIRVTPVQPNKQ